MALSLIRSGGNQLEKLSLSVTAMGGMVEQQLSDAITAFEKRDLSLADQVIDIDRQVDEREAAIEALVQEILEGRRLAGRDLRQVMTALKISNELERIGDLAKNVAKRTKVVSQEDAASSVGTVVRMGRIALRQVTDVLNSIMEKNPEGAIAVWGGDGELDELYNSIFREILTVMMRDPTLVNACTHIVFVAKNFERIGDHATNVAECVFYDQTGEQLKTVRPKRDVTSVTSVPKEKARPE